MSQLAETYLVQAQQHLASGNPDKALSLLEKAKAVGGAPVEMMARILSTAAEAHRRLGHADDAQRLAAQAAKLRSRIAASAPAASRRRTPPDAPPRPSGAASLSAPMPAAPPAAMPTTTRSRKLTWMVVLASVGVAIGRFVVFAVGLSDAGCALGLLVGSNASLLGGNVLFGPFDVGTFGLRKRRTGRATGESSHWTYAHEKSPMSRGLGAISHQ
ncbi:hypothetical protein LCGC14_2891080, partial [marine sediment metagenome]